MQNKIISICETEEMILSNFSSHQIRFKGKNYQTAEHCYHCSRYSESKIINEIFTSTSAREAWSTSQKYKLYEDKDFQLNKESIMKDILMHKYLQHSDVRDVLLKSKGCILEKQHSEDVFWGTGGDGRGKNTLGRLWMDIRDEMIGNS